MLLAIPSGRQPSDNFGEGNRIRASGIRRYGGGMPGGRYLLAPSGKAQPERTVRLRAGGASSPQVHQGVSAPRLLMKRFLAWFTIPRLIPLLVLIALGAVVAIHINASLPSVAPTTAMRNASDDALALAGTSVAFNDAALQTVQVIDDVRQTPAVAHTIVQGHTLQFVTLNTRLVGWDAMGPAQVWDRTLQRLVNLPQLPQTTVSASWVGGHTVIWFDAEAPAQQAQDAAAGLTPGSIINVVDTTTLP